MHSLYKHVLSICEYEYEYEYEYFVHAYVYINDFLPDIPPLPARCVRLWSTKYGV